MIRGEGQVEGEEIWSTYSKGTPGKEREAASKSPAAARNFAYAAAIREGTIIRWPGGISLFHFAEAKHPASPSAHLPAAAARRAPLAAAISFFNKQFSSTARLARTF